MQPSPIAIVGIGQTKPVRRSDQGIRTLVVEAIQAAIDDAGIAAPGIDGVISDGLIIPTTVPRDYVAAQFGIDRRFDGGMSFGGAGTAAPGLAQLAISSGQARTVLYYFGVDWGTRASGPYGFHELYGGKKVFEKPYGFVGQPSYFALWAQRYMHEFGLTEEDLATIGWVVFRDTIPTTYTQKLRKSVTFGDTDPRRHPGAIDLRNLKQTRGKPKG